MVTIYDIERTLRAVLDGEVKQGEIKDLLTQNEDVMEAIYTTMAVMRWDEDQAPPPEPINDALGFYILAAHLQEQGPAPEAQWAEGLGQALEVSGRWLWFVGGLTCGLLILAATLALLS